MLTKVAIHEFLKENGILPSDTVLVHSSMRAIGEIEGGCDGLIDGFVSYLTDGLFLVPTHTWENVNATSPIFRVRETVPCIGALPTVAAFRKDGVRSLHPTHSMAAFGKGAAAFLAGEEKATSPCPPDGAWARLYEKDAKILLIGVGLERNTYIHAIDEMLDLPGRLVAPIPLTIVGYEGEEYTVTFRRHGVTGSRFFPNYRKALESVGALRYGVLGNAQVGIFETRTATEWIKHFWAKADYNLCGSEKDIPLAYYS